MSGQTILPERERALRSARPKWPSALRRAFRRWLATRQIALGGSVILLLVILATFAPLLAPYPPDQIGAARRLSVPGPGHWLGTDEFGRDILSRIVFGTRLTLYVGLVAVGIGLACGTSIGAIAAYSGGWVSGLLMRTIDLLYTFPDVLIALALVAFLGPSLTNAMVAVGISVVPYYARVTYAMGKDTELPVVFGFLHGRFRTPHVGVIVLTVISAVVGAYGVIDVNKLTQVTLISNIGTFLLYGMTNVICVVAFAGVEKRGIFSTVIAPILGAILNVGLLVGVVVYAFGTGGASALNAIIAIVFSLAWLVIGFGYLYYRQLTKGIPILHPEDYKKTADVSLSAASE